MLSNGQPTGPKKLSKDCFTPNRQQFLKKLISSPPHLSRPAPPQIKEYETNRSAWAPKKIVETVEYKSIKIRQLLFDFINISVYNVLINKW